MSEQPRPGLAKTRGEPLVRTREVVQSRVADGPMRALFASADTLTEGAVRGEGAVAEWFGSTSIVLPLPLPMPEERRGFITAVIQRDLHTRLRAVRAARLEATLRAPVELGRSSCEIRLVPDERGVRIDVDIEAPLAHALGAEPTARLENDDR